MSKNDSKIGQGSFIKRLEQLEELIRFREPRLLIVAYSSEEDRDQQLAAITPPPVDADLR